MAAGVLLLWESQKQNNKLDKKKKKKLIICLIISKFGYDYISLNHPGLHEKGESGNTSVQINHCYLRIHNYWSNL